MPVRPQILRASVSPCERRTRPGQVALYLALALVAVTLLTLLNVGVYLAVTARNRAMNAGDAAALAVARRQAELLNEIGALNVAHLKAALRDDEAECARIQEEQSRLCFLGPLRGISLGNAAAQANGAKPSDEMREVLEQHVIDVRTTYVTTPEAYPEPWEGAWEEYAQALEVEVGAPLYAGPDNVEFMDAAEGHLLLDPQFYHAVAGRNWCWFHFNAGGVLDSYSGFGDWPPLPSADDETRRRRSANSEIYSLHLEPRTGSAVDLLGKGLVCRLTDASLADLAQSSLITNQNQVWFFYDKTGDGWRKWTEIDPDGEDRFPVVGPVKSEYDVRGAAAVCRVLGDVPNLLESGEGRTAKWAAAAKPFGTVEAEDGGTDVVTALKGFVTSAFDAVRLVPIDAVGGKDLSTADPEWMRHLREDLPTYLQNGPATLKGGCYYCRQLVDWERPDVRERGRTWLLYNASSCLRPTGGSGGGRGGTPHGH